MISHNWRERGVYFAGGKFVVSDSPNQIVIVNPANERETGRTVSCTLADIDTTLFAARAAFDHGPWPRMTIAERAGVLRRLWEEYVGYYVHTMADLIIAENGSPTAFTAQTDHPDAILRWYTDHADQLEFMRSSSCQETTVTGEPVGVVAVVVPWNMPQKTIMMKVVPALLAGCTVVVKPAPQTGLDALLLAEVFRTIGVPPGVFNVVPALPAVAEYLVTHPYVDKVAFTGSTATGRRIASLCADAVRRCSLELGGKSAAIALDDADPETVVASLRTETFTLSGQICSAHTRLLVPRPLQETYVGLAADLARSLRVGDPRDGDTWIGPLVTDSQRRRVLAYIAAGRHDDARLVVGGNPVGREGWYVEPTVFADVHPTMRIAQEEIFGPVLSIIPYDGENNAVVRAEDSLYGLEAAVWGTDLERVRRVAGRLRVGTVRINGTPADIGAPIGGFKQSGIGRELGFLGFAQYLEPKVTLDGPAWVDTVASYAQKSPPTG